MLLTSRTTGGKTFFVRKRARKPLVDAAHVERVIAWEDSEPIAIDEMFQTNDAGILVNVRDQLAFFGGGIFIL